MAALASQLQEALKFHRQRQWDAAEGQYQQILRVDRHHFEAHYLLGTLYAEKRDWELARTHLAVARAQRPNHVRANRNLALAQHECGLLNDAVASYKAALTADPTDAETWFNFGNALLQLREWEDSANAYGQAIRRRPGFAEARHNLGEVARLRGDFATAIGHYSDAIEDRPDFFASHNNLAILLRSTGDFARAIEHFETAARLAPKSPEPLANLSICLAEIGRMEDAIGRCQQAERLAPNHPLVHESLGRVFLGIGRARDATTAFRNALLSQPKNAEVRLLSGEASFAAGDLDEAAEEFLSVARSQPNLEAARLGMARTAEAADDSDAASAIFLRIGSQSSDRTVWPIRAACACPTVFQTEGDIDAYRDELARAIDQAREDRSPRTLDDLLRIGFMPPFNLQFHGRDNRAIKCQFGDVVNAWLPAPSGNCGQQSPRNRPRIGFVCTQNVPAFVRSIGGLLNRFNNDVLDSVVLCSNAGRSFLENAFAESRVGIMNLPLRPSAMVDFIRAQDFDLLYYFEVGTSPLAYLLPAHRLARVQCCSWGVQDTSGLRSMDYYLSTRLAEPPDAHAHYREELVLLDTLLSWRTRPRVSNATPDPSTIGLPSDRNIYLCPQQIGKFTPAFDAVIGRILQMDQNGVFAITRGNAPVLADRLAARLRRTLANVAERIIFLPQQKGESYLQMIRAAAVLLDPFAFGGVNTTYDALSMGKAVVTLPSTFQRGRYTLGCYRAMNWLDCVAHSEADYIDKAVRLATSRDYREHAECEIRNRASVLFENDRSVEELQSTLVRLATTERSTA